MVSLNTSNTMPHDDALRVKPGHRVESCGYYGTICYIGEVPPTKGIWLGVDWDDPTRGKHNGTHEAKKYFTTRHSTSGSFVRLEKVNLGRSFRAAIRNRYGEVKNDDTAGIDKENLTHLQRGIKARFIEVVGFDKVNKQQSQFEELRVVCLRGQNVNGPGEEGELLQVCPNIQELDLSQNLLHSWQCFARIADQLRHLRVLNVSENQLQIPPQPVEYQGSFQTLEHVIMGRMEYVWSQILDCATMWPFVERLQVPFNNITTLDTPPEGILHHLKSLDLQGNLINDWREINKLGQLPCLEYLNASDVGVKEVYFPVCETEQKTRLFPALKQLNLSENNIDSKLTDSSEVLSVFVNRPVTALMMGALESMNELNKLLLLEELRFHENPVLQDKSAETSRQLIIARIGSLKNLNGAPVTTDERKGAEIDYLKKHGEVWLREAKLSDVTIHKPILDKFIQTHPRYPLLVDKYGAPGEAYTARKFSTNLITVEIFSPDHGGRSYTKKLPQSMQVQTLIGMSQRLFDTRTVIPKLAYISSKYPDIEFPLDNNLKELSFFSIEDGDSITVRW